MDGATARNHASCGPGARSGATGVGAEYRPLAGRRGFMRCGTAVAWDSGAATARLWRPESCAARGVRSWQKPAHRYHASGPPVAAVLRTRQSLREWPGASAPLSNIPWRPRGRVQYRLLTIPISCTRVQHQLRGVESTIASRISADTRECTMSEAWKQWQGQVVDGKFPLRQFLGGSEYSAVFATERGEPTQKGAIKFIQVNEAAAELQLARWKRAAQLSHRHLLRVFDSGRCRLGDFDLLYLVMEYAEENLAQFLPQRPLTPAEARHVLAPTLEGLAYLHAEGLIHGHLRPSNIMAIEDCLKLSADGI